MESNSLDRRKHERFNVERAIYIEVVERGSRTEADNTILRCVTLDVSVGGLRVAVPTAIPQGSTLNIAVPTDDLKDNLELVGKAMWVKEAADHKGYWVGLELQDSSREDMRKWFDVVQELKRKSERISQAS
jgi:c-di-GMP-binding flagellar brake protein YcgR